MILIIAHLFLSTQKKLFEDTLCINQTRTPSHGGEFGGREGLEVVVVCVGGGGGGGGDVEGSQFIEFSRQLIISKQQ